MENETQLKVIIPQQVKPRYANFFAAQNTPNEFTFDYAMATLGSNEIEVHTRVVTSPIGAKQMVEMLMERVMAYEKQYGDIVIPGTPDETKMIRKIIPPKES